MNLGDYQIRLERALQDVGEFLQPDDWNIFLNQAVIMYSKDRPLIKVHEVTGDGTSFDFAMPSDWSEDFSYIDGEIEYPVDDSIRSRSFIEKSEWEYLRKLVSSTTTLYLRFISFIPENNRKARFVYSTLHTLSEDTNTIKDSDSNAVLSMAAALCYWALAARFAQTSDSTIEADVIDYARKSEIYQQLAIEKQNMYRALMGLGGGKDSGSLAAASAGISVKDLDIQYPGSLGDYLTHPSQDR